MSTPDFERLVADLHEALKGRGIEGTRIEEVRLTRGEDDDGNPALFVNLTLNDPPDGATWPVEDVQKLRHVVRDAVLKMLHDEVLRWYVQFEPETADPVEEADARI